MKFCSKCGNQLDENANFCMKCGSPIDQITNQNNIQPNMNFNGQNNNQPNMNLNSQNNNYQQNSNYNNNFGQMNTNNKNNTNNDTIFKVLKIFGKIILSMFVIGMITLIIVFAIMSFSSKKLECTSDNGNITIMYNDKTINGYKAKDLSYDLDGQKKIAEQIGIDEYLNEFSNWFSNNTNGTCTKK